MLQAVRDTHARSVWATTRRNGTWSNIDVFLQLGVGARTEAQLRSRSSFDDLSAILKNMLDQEELAPLHGLISEIQANLPQWREKFLEAVRRSGESAFHPALYDDDEFWNECEEIYRQGRRFRDEV